MMENKTAQFTAIRSRYQLQEKLGEGAMGVVYQALDRLTGEFVALKRVTQLPPQTATLRDTGASAQLVRLALAREFQILAGLRHPNIISVLDYGFGMGLAREPDIAPDSGFDTGDQPFFTMTYLGHPQTILEAAQTQSFTGKIDLLQQLLQALAYLHRQGVIHRDLKPANVLVQDDIVRVLDFGLAETASYPKLAGSTGTPLYMAPELFDGGDCSKATDLYAIGVLTTYIFTGIHPFAPFDFYFLDRVLNAAPNLTGMDERLRPLVMRLLAMRAIQRFERADDALEMLQDILASSGNKSGNTQTSSLARPLETQAIRESYLQAATFVGRETEMDQLTAALAKAKDGHGSAWLVGGESGVGKSRLLREVRNHALVNGFLVLMGQTSEHSVGDAYELWRTPLRQLLLTLPHVTDLAAGVLLPVVPDIAELLGHPVPSAPTLDGEAAQIRLFTTIATLFKQTTQPILLILEDLHWAEAALLAFPHLTHALDESPLIVIGSYRNDERPELVQTLSEMQSLPLNRLTTENMADLSVAMLGEVGQRPDVLQRLQRETEGNAFFAVEVLRALAEDMGGLGHIGESPLPDTLLPDGIQTIVERRLARVPQQEHHLLQLAAVTGRILDRRVLEALSGHDHLEQWITTCTEAAVLDVVDDTWRFQHAKIRDGLLAMMPTDIAKAHHQRVAQAIEQVYPDDPQYAAQLMIHWRQAENHEKEYTYAYQAGTHATNHYAYEDAIVYLSRAYELACAVDGGHDGQRFKQQYLKRQYNALLKRTGVYQLTGQHEQQKADLDSLNKLVDVLAEPSYSAEVAFRQAAHAYEHTNHSSAHVFAETAIAHAQLAGDNLIAARAYRLKGQVWSAIGDYDSAKHAIEQARILVETLGQSKEAGNIFSELGWIAHNQSDFEQAMTYFKQSLHVYTTIADDAGKIYTLSRLGFTATTLAQYQEAQVYLAEGLEICKRIGSIRGESLVANNFASLYYHMGDFDKAKPFYQRTLTITEQLGNKSGVAIALTNLANLIKHQGQMAEANDYYLSALQIQIEAGEKYGQAITLANMGDSWQYQEQIFQQSKQSLERSIALSGALGMATLEAYGFMSLGMLDEWLGYYENARSYLEQALAIQRKTGVRAREGGTLIYLGNCFVAEQMIELAKEHLQDAVMVNREVGKFANVATGLNTLAWIAYQEGEYTHMLAYYQEALAEFDQSTDDASHEKAVSHAGAAWAKFLLGQPFDEPEIVSSLVYLESDPPLMTEIAPFRLHLICYKLFQSIGDPRADEMLLFAHEQIQRYASYIETPEWQASFLSNVPAQREIEELYAARFSE
ncbi:MAG: BREX system ATP-binding domain-containing protein [Chloroflexota bacterium]